MASKGHPARWSGGKRTVRAFGSEPDPPPEPLEQPQEIEPAQQESTELAPEQQESTQMEPEQMLITDAAQQLAAEHGIDTSTVTGTGAEGRITRDDVAALIPTQAD